MFHLFNKVYLSSDKLIDINFDRVVISKENGLKTLKSIEQFSQGVLHYYGKSLKEIIRNTSNQGFSGLIDKFNEIVNKSNKRLIIYVDDENFLNFICDWMKFIYKDIDEESAWQIVNCYVEKEKSYLSWRKISTNSINSKILSKVNKRNFLNKFKSVETHLNSKVYKTIKRNLSFEILLSSFLNDNTADNNYFKNILKNIFHRSMQEVVLEIKHTVYRNLKKPDFMKLIGNVNFFKKSTLFKSEILGQVGSQSQIDIINASEDDINKFKIIAKNILCKWEQFDENSDIVKRIDLIDYVRKDLTLEDIKKILELEKNGKSNARIYSSDDEEKINIYFLDYLLNCKKTELKHFKLR